jgi:DNA replication and repair protein RecF
VVYGRKISGREASTGEQKAVLIRLVLAHCGLLEEMTGFAPVLLLDEVAAISIRRRRPLVRGLAQLGAQTFMTGADACCFRKFPAAGKFSRSIRGWCGHQNRPSRSRFSARRKGRFSTRLRP